MLGLGICTFACAQPPFRITFADEDSIGFFANFQQLVQQETHPKPAISRIIIDRDLVGLSVIPLYLSPFIIPYYIK